MKWWFILKNTKLQERVEKSANCQDREKEIQQNNHISFKNQYKMSIYEHMFCE